MRTVIASLRIGQSSGVEEHLAAMDSLAQRSGDRQSMEEILLTTQGYQFVSGDWEGARKSNTGIHLHSDINADVTIRVVTAEQTS